MRYLKALSKSLLSVGILALVMWILSKWGNTIIPVGFVILMLVGIFWIIPKQLMDEDN